MAGVRVKGIFIKFKFIKQREEGLVVRRAKEKIEKEREKTESCTSRYNVIITQVGLRSSPGPQMRGANRSIVKVRIAESWVRLGFCAWLHICARSCSMRLHYLIGSSA